MKHTIRRTRLTTLIFSFILLVFTHIYLPAPSYSEAFYDEPQAGTPDVQTPPAAETARLNDIGDAFAGEKLVYDMGFWIFRNIARGVFTLTKETDGTYKAVLDATSKARLFRSTRSTFTAHLRKSADNTRFITLSFEKYSKKGKKVKRVVKEIDHEKKIVTITKWRGTELRSTEEIEIPDGVVYDDPLGAFYNLRFGAYGSIEKEGELLITTFPEKGKDILIQARKANEKEFKKGLRKRKNNAKLLIKARLDKELFESSSGDIDLYFDENMVTIDVVAKDILLFGDIYARINRDKSKIPGAPVVPDTPDSDGAGVDSEKIE